MILKKLETSADLILVLTSVYFLCNHEAGTWVWFTFP